MANLLADLSKRGSLHIQQRYVVDQLQYLVQMGSVAYGVATNYSDADICGFCIPEKHIIFPHLIGVIPEFGQQGERFGQWQQHHVFDKNNNKQYDFSIYSIIKYFQLCMENNPNMIDSLFVPLRCILHITPVGEIVRENRKQFLHKGSWWKFKGYAYSQIHKMKTKQLIGKRKETVEKYGFDLKFLYHTVRLLNEAEQILTEHDLDLERNREQLKAIRRGEWTQEQGIEYFEKKEKELESLYTISTLPHFPNEQVIKGILLSCLEQHFGSLDNVLKIEGDFQGLYRELTNIVERFQPNER